MTPKEAYRYICYIFHNKQPGYKKIEKKLKRDEMEQKMENKDISTEAKTFKFLKNQQNKNNNSYVVLQGKNNNI
jgi:U4/U6.U5 tri-snRNP-associated protein 1